MTHWRRHTILAVAAMFALGLACSHPSKGGGPTSLAACDDYFDAIIGVSCDATTPPADELARIQTLFETICQDGLALPGNGATAASIESCASALTATGCANLDIPECSFQGSLTDGSPCNDASQCQSGDCATSTATTGDGGGSSASCGTCAAGVAVGQPCATGDTCVYGSVCAVAGAGYACTVVAYGDVGAACDGLSAECNTGLYCDFQAQQCASPAGAGASCTGTLGCAPPLVCSAGATGTAATCQDAAGAGGPCQTDQDCAAGLGCSTTTSQCTAVTWVAQGKPCGGAVLCLVGACPLTHGSGGPGGTGGTCPVVIGDGQPCTRGDASQTCDTFSACTGGVCVQPDSVTCQ